ncbi:MAG: hypothetical protein NT152_06645 [Actinobacteria bacterium]|nr:hypothetical protein [Actinomycetota bacterium]
MKNKFTAAALIALFSFFSLPQSEAVDVPLLTWERGKEQNIVLGGQSVSNTWKIYLVGNKSTTLEFKASKVNSSGFVVYSISVPSDLPVGAYTIETVGKNSPRTVVAGVRLVKLMYYTISQIPQSLIFLLVVAAFLTSTFSTLRGRKYSEYTYLRSHTFAEDDVDGIRSIPRLLRRVYRIRRDSLRGIKESFLRFNLETSGQMLHKFLPTLWALSPVVGVVLGLAVAWETQAAAGIPNTPFFILAAVAIFGVLDSYAAIVALASFTFFQVITGYVSSLRDLMAVIALGIGWFGPGLISNLYLIIGGKDFGSLAPKISDSVKRTINVCGGALLGGSVFMASQVLTESLAVRTGADGGRMIIIATAIAAVIIAKGWYEPHLDHLRLTKPGHQLLEVDTFTLKRVISPLASVLIFVMTAILVYVWTSSLQVSGVAAVVTLVPFALLLVRFSKPRISFLAKIPRQVLAESIVVCVATLGVYEVIQTLPYEVNQKSELFLLIGFVPAFVHAIYSALHDIVEKNGEAIA